MRVIFRFLFSNINAVAEFLVNKLFNAKVYLIHVYIQLIDNVGVNVCWGAIIEMYF